MLAASPDLELGLGQRYEYEIEPGIESKHTKNNTKVPMKRAATPSET